MANKLHSKRLDDSLFITLTYPRDYTSDASEWKRHLDVFMKRVARRCKNPCVIWKLEFQKRGAPHFHLVVLERKFISRSWIAEAWNKIVGGGEDHLAVGTHVMAVKEGTSALWYIAGYLGKQAAPPSGCKWTGRWWGMRGKAAYVCRRAEFPLTDGQFYDFVRFARRYQEARGWRVAREGDGYRYTFMPLDTVSKWHAACVVGVNGLGLKISLRMLGLTDKRFLPSEGIHGEAGGCCGGFS